MLEQIPLFAEPVRVPMSQIVLHTPAPPARPGPKRIDWFRVITEVLRSGYSIQGAADEIGVARTTLIGWKQGAEPRYSEGERLVLLWCQVTEQDRNELPMVAASDWWAYHSK
ncbi:hypothetical protein HX867_04035 [Pseudomonas gingeri]|uniref:hypothetical protein n=1 Tax=Pseudomonas gingeri TaxID=117681 RepID=UPI0015A16097|nr:hypothetical protein [Pseudomonas gingeri]NVZ61243.1 hypothetical protein [Pseudomonas gingeri]NVZ77140.1 hypothetical protein [Pseudomonas gingeri]NWE46354.1 hypothetical protein [Pseudomonas gingeri]